MSQNPLRLRHWDPSDGQALLDICQCTPRLDRQFPNLTSAEEASEFIAKHWAPDPGRTILCIDDGRAAGLAGVDYTAWNDDGEWDRGWVFYWIADHLRNRRITSAAVSALCDWALDEEWRTDVIDATILDTLPSPRLRRLELGYRTNNLGSAGVARRAGFTVEGIEREKFLYDGVTYDAVVAGRLQKKGR